MLTFKIISIILNQHHKKINHKKGESAMKAVVMTFLFLLQLLAPRTTALYDNIENNFLRHRVGKGESLVEIARLYGTTVREIISLNRISSFISENQELFVVPRHRETVVSWYGEDFNGKETASGEIFYASKVLVAHKELPLGSVVEFINPEKQKKIVVKVLDRGPYINGREFDLSEKAAWMLGIHGEGVARVIVRILFIPS